MGRKSKDYTGLIFGKLTVIKKTDKKDSKGNYLWECKCECGNTCYYIGSKLPTRKSCGCSHNAINEESYIGKHINNWYVIDKSYKTNKGWMMKCQCVCGTIKDVNIYNLVNNKTKDCGCGRKQMLIETKRKHTLESLKNKKFGKLTVIEESGKDKYGKILYKCKCDCGNTITVLGRSLLSNHTQSCGCINSIHNSQINEFLNNLNYETVQEKIIKLPNNTILRFDIYVPKLNLAIEYDGEQHFIPVDFAGKGKEWAEQQLKETKKRDKLKNLYCNYHKINLLRIPYTKKNNIEQIILNKINSITNND